MVLLTNGFNRHKGSFYIECLTEIHKSLNPQVYLEIGTAAGDTLSIAKNTAIAVDPELKLKGEFVGSKEKIFLFQLTSDDFFSKYADFISRELKPDFSFLDGMHRFEFLLRDFINTERVSSERSIVAMHDCLPLDINMACRDESDFQTRNLSLEPTWWTGDVWKVVSILKRYRPDLSIELFDAPPTGLVIVKNLDSSSTILRRCYQEIVTEFSQTKDCESQFSQFIESSKVLSTSHITKYLMT